MKRARIPAWLSACALIVPLCGCASDADVIDDAIAGARAQCEAQGKQFHLKDTPKLESGDLMARDVEIDGECIGPGDPSYVVPAKSDSSTGAG